MSQIYKLFAENFKNVSFTPEDAMEVYLWESTGKGDLKPGVFPTARAGGTCNGYAIGKIWKDFFVTEWKRDIKKGLLFVWELYMDKRYPRWWLDKIFGRKVNADTDLALNTFLKEVETAYMKRGIT